MARNPARINVSSHVRVNRSTSSSKVVPSNWSHKRRFISKLSPTSSLLLSSSKKNSIVGTIPRPRVFSRYHSGVFDRSISTTRVFRSCSSSCKHKCTRCAYGHKACLYNTRRCVIAHDFFDDDDETPRQRQHKREEGGRRRRRENVASTAVAFVAHGISKHLREREREREHLIHSLINGVEKVALSNFFKKASHT